jgi:osmotically-inducible protein OsmY
MDYTGLQHAVAEELQWAPHLDASDITVTVRDGIVRLTGFVASLAEKHAAERAVWHVRGVRGLAQEVEVLVPEARRHSDDAIAHRALSVLRWDTQIPGEGIQIKVDHGVVTLIGTVDWQFQREAAEERIRNLAGVTAVDNRLGLRPTTAAADIKKQIERAFRRHTRLHAAGITVDIDGSKVILTGHVPSVEDREAAENMAWSAAGVAEVEDHVIVLG